MLFPKLNAALKAERFESIESIQQNVKTVMKRVPTSNFNRAFYGFYEGIESGGIYVEN